MIWLLAAVHALAQDAAFGQRPDNLDAQLFRPAHDAQHTLWTGDSLRGPSGSGSVRLLTHYADQPLVYERISGDTVGIVSSIWQADLTGVYRLGAVQLGVRAPVILRASSDVSSAKTGIGDAAVQARWAALDRTDHPIGIALSTDLRLPTGTVASVRAGGVSGTLVLAADTQLTQSTALLVNLGMGWHPPRELENLQWSAPVLARLALSQTLRPNTLGMSLELAAQAPIAELSNRTGRSVEGLVGGWWRLNRDIVVRAGAGTGLQPGVGTAGVRGLLSVGWEPSWVPMDRDADGIPDVSDACPQQREDLDGVLDADGCPEGTLLTLHVVDQDGIAVPDVPWTLGPFNGHSGATVEVESGALELSINAPGYVPVQRIQDVANGESTELTVSLDAFASLAVQAVDPEGNPIIAAWSINGEPTSQEVVSLPSGEYTVQLTADGFQPATVVLSAAAGDEVTETVTLQPSRATLSDERIEITESVFFETGQAVIKSESYPLLNDVAQVMSAHPEVRMLRIEGHTDSRGADDANQTLSQARASAVLAYLVEAGVTQDRLQAVGYGESRPIDPADTAQAWAQNRRVDFVVADRTQP